MSCHQASGSSLKTGTTTVTCKTVNSAGNAVGSKTVPVTVEHTIPPENVKIISAVDKHERQISNGATNVPSNSITFQLSKPTDNVGVASLDCSIDGRTTGCPASGSISYSNLYPGSHTFTFTAKDADGNSSYDRFSWTISANAKG